jgi:hypothetical protein
MSSKEPSQVELSQESEVDGLEIAKKRVSFASKNEVKYFEKGSSQGVRKPEKSPSKSNKASKEPVDLFSSSSSERNESSDQPDIEVKPPTKAAKGRKAPATKKLTVK